MIFICLTIVDFPDSPEPVFGCQGKDTERDRDKRKVQGHGMPEIYVPMKGDGMKDAYQEEGFYTLS